MTHLLRRYRGYRAFLKRYGLLRGLAVLSLMPVLQFAMAQVLAGLEEA